MNNTELKHRLQTYEREIGYSLRRERLLAGWSQAQLGTALGVSFQQVQKYEHGANRLSAGKLRYVAELLAISPLQLLGGDENAVALPADRLTLQLVTQFLAIEDILTQRLIIELCRALGNRTADDDSDR